MREYVCVCVVIIGEPARSGDAGPEVPYDGPFSTVKAMGARHLKRRAVLEGTPLTLRAVLVGLNGPRSENGVRDWRRTMSKDAHWWRRNHVYGISSGVILSVCVPSLRTVPTANARFVCPRTTGVAERAGLVSLDLRRVWRRGCRFSLVESTLSFAKDRTNAKTRTNATLSCWENTANESIYHSTKHLPSLGPLPGSLDNQDRDPRNCCWID